MTTSRKKTAPTSAAASAKPKKAAGESSPQKDPDGGLTAAGRKAFAEKEGANLRPGVQGPADTPDKMRRKGSFLRRHFANPRGPLERDGKPTRLALSAHAWGEPVPKTSEDAKKLAERGHKLLEQYQRTKEDPPKTKSAKSSTSGSQRKAAASKATKKAAPKRARTES